MRLFLIAALSLTGFWSMAQEQSFLLDVNQQTILEIIKELEEKYQIKFSYNPKALEQDTVSFKIDAKTETELIEKVFENADFKVRKSKEVYLIIPSKKDKKKTSHRTPLNQRVKKTKPTTPLKPQDDLKTTTDDVEAEKKVNQNTFQVSVSPKNYQNQPTFVSPANRNFDVRAHTDSLTLKAFIESSPPKFNYLSSKTSHLTFNTQLMSQLPSLGQMDVFKSMQLTPGVSATDETLAGLVIRGSAPSQNLVIFDGFTIYHVDHFFGIFSTFNPMVVRDVDLYKGGFGAEYGGRLSSVTYIHGKAAEKDKVHASIGLYMTSTDFKIETPIGQKMSWLMGLRVSNSGVLQAPLYRDFLDKTRFDVIESSVPEFYQKYELNIEPSVGFYDLYSKYRVDFSPSEHLDINVYLSGDGYKGNETFEDESLAISVQDEADWYNLGFSTNWRKYINQDVYQELVVGLSAFSGTSTYLSSFEETQSFDAPTEDADIFDFYDFTKSNGINDMTVKYFLNFDFHNIGSFDVGVEQKFIGTSNDIKYFDDIEQDTSLNAGMFATFLTYKLNREKIQASAGVRLQYYEPTNFRILEPRLGLNYNITSDLSLKSSYSIHHQFIHQLSLSPFGNSDQYYWVLADGAFYPVQSSQHAIIGAEYRRGKWLFDLEGYRIDSKGVLESDFTFYSVYSEQDIDDLSDFILGGSNQSIGLDFLAKYQTNKYESWLSYTLSKSENQMDEIKGGLPYFSTVDQRHEINWSQVYKFRNWEFSSVFIYGSGKPFTPVTTFEIDDPIYYPIYELDLINDQRLPAYHRLDLAAKFNFKLKRISGETGITLHNVYNRKNIKSRRYGVQLVNEDSDTGEELTAAIVPIDIVLLGFTPNLFLRINI